MERKYIKSADVVITVNDFIADLMSKRYGIKKPEVILNCANLPESGPEGTVDRDVLVKKCNIPAKYRHIIIYQGWITGERNLDILVHGLPWLKKDTCLVFIGYGHYEGALKEMVKKEGVDDRVFFMGSVPNEELLKYTMAADIGIIPYLPVDENHLYCSPNKFFEFVVAGIPIITGTLPFFMMMENQFGILKTVDMTEPRQWAEAANSILEDRQRYWIMQENCRKAAEQLNWDVEKEKLVSIYQKLWQ